MTIVSKGYIRIFIQEEQQSLIKGSLKTVLEDDLSVGKLAGTRP